MATPERGSLTASGPAAGRRGGLGAALKLVGCLLLLGLGGALGWQLKGLVLARPGDSTGEQAPKSPPEADERIMVPPPDRDLEQLRS